MQQFLWTHRHAVAGRDQCIHAFVYARIHTRIYACMYTSIYACKHARKYACMNDRKYACSSACLQLCNCECQGTRKLALISAPSSTEIERFTDSGEGRTGVPGEDQVSPAPVK